MEKWQIEQHIVLSSVYGSTDRPTFSEYLYAMRVAMLVFNISVFMDLRGGRSSVIQLDSVMLAWIVWTVFTTITKYFVMTSH